MAGRKLSLRRELFLLYDAVEAARILAEGVGTHHFSSAYDEWKAPYAASGVLRLVGERLRNLERAIQGELNPYLLVNHRNDVGDDGDESDIYLSEWSPDKCIEKAQAELARAERQRRRERGADE